VKKMYLLVIVAFVLAAFIFQTVGVSADSSGSISRSQSVNLSIGSENLSLEQLTDESDAVLLGTVSSTSSRWDAGHKLIVTDAIVSVNSVLKGDKKHAPGAGYPGWRKGGRYDPVCLRCSQPECQRAERIIFEKRSQ